MFLVVGAAGVTGHAVIHALASRGVRVRGLVSREGSREPVVATGPAEAAVGDLRDPERFGTAGRNGWTEDKLRQYGDPQRADFGALVRGKRSRLD